MKREQGCLFAAALGCASLAACSSDSATTDTGTAASATSVASGSGGATSGTGGASGTMATSSASGGGVTTGSGGATGCAEAADVKTKVEAYKAAHPGNGGKDWDINAKTPAQIAADPDAQALLALCTPDQRPVIPLIAWEYGGADHPWIKPGASALVYCVYTPVNPGSDHWKYDAASDHVSADVYVKFPCENPCKDKTGADQVMACLGDPTNIEILVDTASLNDGADAGLSLANASTDLYLILPDGTTKVHMYTGL